MNEKIYIFWVGQIRYSGYIISENNTHWFVVDSKVGRIEIPKTAVRQEVAQ